MQYRQCSTLERPVLPHRHHLTSSLSRSRPFSPASRPTKRIQPPVASTRGVTAMSKVQYRNPSGELLVGVLTDDNLQDAVVLCHGYMDGKDRFHFPTMADALLRDAQVASLRFDFAGNGESEGEFDFCAYDKEVEDIRASVEYLRSSLGKRVVAVVGHSKGAAEAILYASRYDDVDRVVSISARFDMVRGITERFGEDIFDRLRRGGHLEMRHPDGRTWRLTEKSVKERVETNMEEAASLIQSTKVFTIHGAADEVIPIADAHAFDRCIKQHVLRVVPGANHNYTQPEHAQVLVQQVVEWVKTR